LLLANAELGNPGNAKLRIGDVGKEIYGSSVNGYTGDLGYLDKDGFLWLTGRKAEILKTSAGRRIAPAKVEAVYRRDALVNQIVVVGHGRPYLSALLTLNEAEAIRCLRRRGVEVGVQADLRENKEVWNMVQEELERLGSDLPAHERVRAFHVLPKPLAVESGELTSNLKPRRAYIAEKYAAEIACLYAQDWPMRAAVAAGRGGRGVAVETDCDYGRDRRRRRSAGSLFVGRFRRNVIFNRSRQK
jgi:hypothetical protein